MLFRAENKKTADISPRLLLFLQIYVIKKSLFRYAAHSREKHAESHNTAPNDKYVQRNPVQFVVTQLTISCPN